MSRRVPYSFDVEKPALAGAAVTKLTQTVVGDTRNGTNRKRSGKSTSRICARNFLDHARLDRSGAREPTQPTPIETREHPRLWAIPPRSMHENPFEGCPGGDVSFVGDTRICLRSI